MFVFVPGPAVTGSPTRLVVRTAGPGDRTAEAARRASFVPKYCLCSRAVILAFLSRINHPNNARSQRFKVCQIPTECPFVCVAESVAALALRLPASAKERFQLPQTIHDFQPLLTHCVALHLPPRQPSAAAGTQRQRHTIQTPTHSTSQCSYLPLVVCELRRSLPDLMHHCLRSARHQCRRELLDQLTPLGLLWRDAAVLPLAA